MSSNEQTPTAELRAEDGPQPGPNVRMIVKVLDAISDISGKVTGILVLPMMFVLVYEVIMRYVFNAPTIWAGETALILYGIYFMIASPYCLKEGGHIRTDFLYSHWSPRTQGIVDCTIYILFFFPAHLIFLDVGWEYFYESYTQDERLTSGAWLPIIWPMKFAIPASIVLLIFQGVAETIKSFYAARYNKWLWVHADGHGSKDDPNDACQVTCHAKGVE